MKIKNSFFFLVFITAVFTVTAQNKTSDKIHLGFVTPISTQGNDAKKTSTTFALHALQGVNYNNNGFSVAGVYTQLEGNNRGLMVSGLVNNIKGSNKGVAVAGLFNKAGNGRGMQIAGLYNYCPGNGYMQVAGVGNNSRHAILQIAGLVNTAQNADIQIGGLVNKAKNVNGVQIAGLVNIADSSPYPIGLVNIIKNGEKQIGIQVYADRSASVVLRTGSKTYGIIGVGISEHFNDNVCLLEGGIGYRIPLTKWLRINAEAVSIAKTDVSTYIQHTGSLRTLVGCHISKNIELFIGPSLNAYDDAETDAYHGKYIWRVKKYQRTISFSAGAMAGISINL